MGGNEEQDVCAGIAGLRPFGTNLISSGVASCGRCKGILIRLPDEQRVRAGLRHSKVRFYEAYWSKEGKAVPDEDPTTEERKHVLALSLRQLAATRDRPGKILDAGCGNGEFTMFIKELGFEVVGIDTAVAAIERARARYPNITFYIGSLEDRLLFHDGEFQAIWSTEVLEHLFDVHACLSELNRVLAQNGLLILTTPFHGLLKNIAITLMAFERHFNPYLSHIRFFTRRSLTECLTRAGFDPVLWRGIGRSWPLYKSFFVVARKVRAAEPPPEIIG